MFNIGGGEFLVIGLIALIVLGPSRLPDAARQVGKVMGDLRRISNGFQNEIRTAFDDTERSPDPLPPAFPVVQPLGGPATMDEMASAVAAVSSQADPEPAKKAPTKKKAPAKRTAAKKVPAKKIAAKKAPAKQAAPTKRAQAKKAATKKAAPTKKAPAKKGGAVPTGPRRRSPS